MEVKPTKVRSRRKSAKKRSATDLSPSQEGNATRPAETIEAHGEFGMSELTMGEKLEMLRLLEDAGTNAPENEQSPDIKLPSVDSMHILLKQALNAEDHVLLLNCLNTRDEKVISNSVAQLSPADVLRLLNSLVSITHSRGSALICAIPWLRSTLIHHASSIVAQESSLSTLNSLYQLIESRTSTLASALQLSTSIDFLFTGIVSDEIEEESTPPPLIFEDKDSDDEEESEGDMESGEDDQPELMGGADMHYDSDGSDVVSQIPFLPVLS